MDEPGLGGLLHDVRDLLRKHLRWWVLPVHLPVRLCALTRSCDENSEIWTHSGVNDSDVWADDRDLLDNGIVDEDG